MSCKKNISRGCCFDRNENGEAIAMATKGSRKMDVHDWVADIPDPMAEKRVFEVQFKNTRKSYYENSHNLEIAKGDIVVVESTPGYDVGIVTMTSDLVSKQMIKHRFNPQDVEFKKITRKATAHDIEKWQEAIALEHNTMIRSRQISSDLGLKMKIGDVEYQGDRMKAIFYYIADERVDFRELIKVLAEQFRVRIEMKQIGARQEAGRIGGIAACGRELCCSTWQNSFQSVTIGSARQQEISLNPQKLAGQCGKLKCCLNYEVDNYIDARREFPRLNAPLEALDGSYYLVKNDIFKRVMWFSPDPNSISIMIPLGIDRVREIMAMNRRGTKVDRLEDERLVKKVEEEPQYKNVVGEESITRFDKSNGGSSSRRRGRGRDRNNSGDRRNDTNGANVDPNGAKTENGVAKSGLNKDNNSNEKSENTRSRRPARNRKPASNASENQQQQGVDSENRRNGNNDRNAERAQQPKTNTNTSEPRNENHDGAKNGGSERSGERNRNNRPRPNRVNKPKENKES